MALQRLYLAVMIIFLLGFLAEMSGACPLPCQCTPIPKKSRGLGGGLRGTGGRGGSSRGRLVNCTGKEIINPPSPRDIPADAAVLDLSNNSMKTLRQGAFSGLAEVQILNLSMNSISYIEPKAFEGLTSLQVLDLSRNQLGSVNNSMFVGLGSLQELLLGHNQLITIADASFDRLSSLKRLDFQSEYLVCDCKLSWIVKWERKRNIKIADTTTCVVPDSLHGTRVKNVKQGQLHCNGPLEQMSRFEIQPFTDQLVFKGDPITLRCIATQLDPTQYLMWLRNGQVLKENASEGISIQTKTLPGQGVITSTLKIEQIQMDSTGLWNMECRTRSDRQLGTEKVTVNLYIFGNVSESHKCQADLTTNNKGTFNWPSTLPTMTEEIPCPRGGGSRFVGRDPTKATARRMCSDAGIWLPPKTDSCQFADMTTTMLENIAQARYSNVSLALTAAKQVEIETADAHSFTDKYNVIFVGRFIEKIKVFTSEELGQVMVNIASNLMEVNSSLLAESQLMNKSCSTIVSALEEFASNILHSSRSIDIDHFAPNIAVRAIRMTATNSFSGMLCAAFVPGPGQLDDFSRQNVKCHMNNMTSAQLDITKGPIETSIRLPPTIFQSLTPTQRLMATQASPRPGLVLQFFVYKNGRLFPSLKTTADGQLALSERAVTSMVVASKIENYDVVNLTDPVTLTFRPSSQGHSAMPVYWDFQARDSHGEWKSDGCEIVHKTENMTTVNCNHLTNFAILKDFSEPHERYLGNFWLNATLDPAIYIGSFILLILLFITLLTYMCFHSNIRMKRRCRHALINICLAVMFLVVFYTGGVNRTEPALLCQIVGIALHYFTVCALMWMVIQANNLRKALIRQNRPPLPPGETPPPPRPIMRFYFVGWGIPMIVVGITAAASPDIGNYGGTEFCWIVDFKVSLAAFFGIAAALVILTCAMFVWASMHITIAPSLPQLQTYESREQSLEPKDAPNHRGENGTERQTGTDNESVVTHRTGISGLSSVMDSEYTYAKQITAAILMMVGFVGTWTFGALAITQEGFLVVLFCYLYSLTAVGLGLFIFVYNCGMRNDVKYHWKKACGCTNKDQYAVAVTSGQPTSPLNNGHVVHRRQSASSVDSNNTNRSNNTNHSYPSVVSGSRKTTSKCNYVPSHTNTGTDASVDSSTQDNAGRVHNYDKQRSNGYPHRYHKQGRNRSKNHKHSRYSQMSREGQEVVSAHPMVPVVPNGAGRTGSSSSFPIAHMHHVDASMQSPASSNSYIPQHIHYMGSHPRVMAMPQELHSSHSGLGMSSQPEALCTTQSWDALRENSLPRSTASSDRYSRDRTGFVHGVRNHYIDYPHNSSMPRNLPSRKPHRDDMRRGSASKNSSRDKLPRHEDIAEYPSPESNPLLERTHMPYVENPSKYAEVTVPHESHALIGGHAHLEVEPVNGNESEHRLMTAKEFQMSQNALSNDKRETSV